MAHAEVLYQPGKTRSRKPGFQPAEPILATVVYCDPSQSLTATMAKFLGIRENELRRELQRLKRENLLVAGGSKRDPRLTRYIRIDDGTRRRGYVLRGPAENFIGPRRAYRPPPSHLRRKGAPRQGRLLTPFHV